ncbi:type VI secretion system baseplate subunit TssK [Sorangium sp. So ce1389]|uniref:type VI secretion system baseplate subunit TssK n=1 Tax=Sorangium sp. So ce1389 TaxID=3133336 RepID=UPI003F5DD942
MRRAAEVPAAVQWHDGMLLSPQHFQESARRSERLLDYHLGQLHPFHHGVHHLEVDVGLLASGMLRVLELEAVLPDHLLVHHAARDPELQVDLKPHAAELAAGPLTAYLAVPREHLGGAAVGGEFARYRSIEGAPIPDENTGEEPLPIPRLVPLARLLVAAAPPARFVCLPLAQVRREGEAFVRTEYLPPCMAVPLASPLGILCGQIVARLREKALRLADRLSAHSLTKERELIAELRRQIHALVAALPPFEVVLGTGRSHPYPLYLGLSALVGQLAALARMPVPPVLPAYQHDDLRTTFRAARDHIFRLIDEGILESFTAHPFDFGEGRYRVEFQRRFAGRPVLVAARGRRGTPEKDVISWVESALIGSARRAREMQQSRVLGVGRRRVDRYEDLIAPGGTVLFQLEEASPYLDPDEPLLVFNTGDPTAAAGPAELVLYVKVGDERA